MGNRSLSRPNEKTEIVPTTTAAPLNITRNLVMLLLWMLAVAGVLHAEPLLQRLFGSGHSICGVWGCGPPISALLVWNGFVAALLVPLAIFLASRFPLMACRWGACVLSVTLFAVALFLLINTVHWYQGATELSRAYCIRRVLFAAVSFTDAPVLPCSIAAAVFYWLSRRKLRPAVPG